MLDYKLQKQVNFSEQVYKKSLSAIDFYGSPIQIQIKGQQQFSTSIGLMISIAIIVTCFLFFWQNLTRAIYQSTPSVYSSEMISLETQPIKLTVENFTMAIVLTDNNLKSIQGIESVYDIKVSACKRDLINNQGQKINPYQVCQQLNIETCKIGVHFVTPKQREYFKYYNLSNIHCVSQNQTENAQLFLQGSASSNQFQYIKISIAVCNNETSNNTCSSRQEIDSKLSYGYYAIFTSDNLVDMSLSGNPYTMTTDLFFTAFTYKESKNIVATYKQSFTQTDDGYITDNVNQFAGLIKNGQQEYPQPLNSDFFIQHNIILDQKQINYFRSFQKLQIVFGSLGGLWNVLYHLCYVFMFPLVKKLMYLEIINKIFTFDQEDIKTPGRKSISYASGRKSIINNPEGINTINKVRPNNFTNQPTKDQDQIRKDSKRKKKTQFIIKQLDSVKRVSFVQKINSTEDIRNYLKSKQSSLKIGLRSVIALVFCCQLKKEKAQIDYGAKKISQKLDVFYIIRKLFEIEKLKMVLLNDEQQKIFNYLPKPCIPHDLHQISNGSPVQKVIKEYERKLQFRPMLQEEETELKRVSNAYKAYKTIQASNQKSDLDRKLILCLDQDITSLFDQLILKDEIECEEQRISVSELNSVRFNTQNLPNSPQDQQILSSPISRNKLMLQILSKQADSCDYLEDH